MTLSTLLAADVFAACTPTRSLWDPRLAAERVCHLDFMLLAKIMCGMSRDPMTCSSEGNLYVRMGCFCGLFPGVAAFAYFVERKYEAKRKDHRLHFLGSRRFVSHRVAFLPAFRLTIDSAALEFAVSFELPVSM